MTSDLSGRKSIEHGPRHSDALIAVVLASQLMKVGVGIMGDARQLVKKAEAFRVELIARLRLRSPQIPWKHLNPVECREVAHEIARDEPEAEKPSERDAEQRGTASPARHRRQASDAVRKWVRGTSITSWWMLSRWILFFVKLRVSENPAFLIRVPKFAYPMVLELWRVEVGAETAARPRRHALGAQH